MSTTTDIEQQIEWLREFQGAYRKADAALRVISGQIVTLREAGLDGVADKLAQPFVAAVAGMETMDAAVNRMISEDFEHSLKTTDETFRALLGSLGGEEQSE